MKIIKKIIFFAALNTLSSVAIGQQFNAGLTAGLVASDVYGADIVADEDAWNDTDFGKAGFMFGGIVSTSVGKKSLLQMEINYIQKGTQQSADDAGQGFYKYAFTYIEVPFIFKYPLHFKLGKKTVKALDIQVGISAARLISSKAEGDDFYSEDDYSYLNRTDVSLHGGIGYNFLEHFNFSFRYSNSLIPVFESSGSPIYFAQGFNVGNNMVLHFMLQYMFGARKSYSPPVEEDITE